MKALSPSAKHALGACGAFVATVIVDVAARLSPSEQAAGTVLVATLGLSSVAHAWREHAPPKAAALEVAIAEAVAQALPEVLTHARDLVAREVDRLFGPSATTDPETPDARKKNSVTSVLP